MKDRNELEALEALIRAYSGEKEVIENMEKEGQQRAVINTLVAKKMDPKREVWEKLGFKFSEIPGDSVLVNAQLPDGWNINSTEHPMWCDIVDDKGRTRGSMFYKAAFYDRDAHMSLCTRYGVRRRDLDENGSCEIYFGSDDEVLFVAGSVYREFELKHDDLWKFYDEAEALSKIARDFGRENYPDYDDPTAYWDDKKELSLKPKTDK